MGWWMEYVQMRAEVEVEIRQQEVIEEVVLGMRPLLCRAQIDLVPVALQLLPLQTKESILT